MGAAPKPAGNLLVDVPAAADYDAWLALWNGNNMGRIDAAVTAETWRRLLDPKFPIYGLVARKDGKLAGLVHYILHPVTGHIKPVCYMQDLYVDPAFRRQGIARALVGSLAALGQKAGWARLYWLAAGDNEAAQALYGDLGIKLNFSLHVLPLA